MEIRTPRVVTRGRRKLLIVLAEKEELKSRMLLCVSVCINRARLTSAI